MSLNGLGVIECWRRPKIDQGVQSTCLLNKQGAEVITMDMLGKVRRMKMRDGISISQIAKRTALARVDLNKTVYTFSINVSTTSDFPV